MGGKKKSNKCQKRTNTSEDDFIQEALHAKIPSSVYMSDGPPRKLTREFKLPDDSFTRKLHRDIDAEGSEILISGTTAEDLGFKKSDYKFGELDIPEYNGQMERKDFSLTDPESRSEEGRSPED